VIKCPWPEPPDNLSIGASEVHVWFAALDQPPEVLERFHASFSVDEQQRAERFRIGNLRNHYVAARGMMREVLARYLGTSSQSLAFTYAAHGKPSLASSWRDTGLDFNLAHSHCAAVLAVTQGEPIGVDIEQIRPMPNAGALMERFFAAEEIDAWKRLNEKLRLEAFFRGWTRKEAYLKAVGSGLSFPLDRFCITIDPSQTPRVLSIDGDVKEAARWWLTSFDPAETFVAALAMRGTPRTLRLWNFLPRI